jgi:hypothetical protein
MEIIRTFFCWPSRKGFGILSMFVTDSGSALLPPVDHAFLLGVPHPSGVVPVETVLGPLLDIGVLKP